MFRFAVSKNGQRLADYHGEGSPANVMQLVEGRSLWQGTGSAALKIENTPCTRSQMLALSSGKHPATGQQLTPPSGQRADRRAAFDCVFAAPKPVSLLALMAGDGRVLAAHTRAVHAALLYMESMACANDADLAHVLRPFTPTKNVVAAHLLHTHSRRSQPHLHSHLVLFNLTFEASRRRWLALQAKPIFKHVPLIQRIYHGELAVQLQHAGYNLDLTSPRKLLIHGFPEELIRLFSSNDEIRAAALARYNDTKISSLKWANDSSRPATKTSPESLELDASRWRSAVPKPALLEQLFACVPDYPDAPAAPPDPAAQLDKAREITRAVTSEHFSKNLFLRPNAILRDSLSRAFGKVSPVAVVRSVQQFFSSQRTRLASRIKSSRLLSSARSILTGEHPAILPQNHSLTRPAPLLRTSQVATVAIISNGRASTTQRSIARATGTRAEHHVGPTVARLDTDIAFSIIGAESRRQRRAGNNRSLAAGGVTQTGEETASRLRGRPESN